jgi:cytochrome c peroxidase
MKQYIFCILLFCIASAFVTINKLPFVIPEQFPIPAYDFSNNQLTNKKVELGRALFYDPLLSQNNKVSCASCHSPFNAFAHTDHALSHGINDSIGTRNAPALFNLAWQKTFMWDGAINHLDMQALAPISHPSEMGESLDNVVKKLQSSMEYSQWFYDAFGDSAVTGQRVLLALSQFELSLVSANSKYDSVMRRQTSFDLQEANGYRLYKINCAACHIEPLFSTYEFANNGLPVDTTLHDYGRWLVTHQSADSLQFKIPSLRNLEYSYPYMHDGRFKRLTDVLNHYTSGIQKSKTLARSLQKPIVLSSNEKTDLIAFLLTLSDKSFVFNPAHAPLRKNNRLSITIN